MAFTPKALQKILDAQEKKHQEAMETQKKLLETQQEMMKQMMEQLKASTAGNVTNSSALPEHELTMRATHEKLEPFYYVPDDFIFFEGWWKRYKHVFEDLPNEFPEQKKVEALCRRLETTVYNRLPTTFRRKSRKRRHLKKSSTF